MANPLDRRDYRETKFSDIPDFDQILIGQALTSAHNLADLRVESAGRTYYQVRVEQAEYLIIDTIMQGCLEAYHRQVVAVSTPPQPSWDLLQTVETVKPALRVDEKAYLLLLLTEVQSGKCKVQMVDDIVEISNRQRLVTVAIMDDKIDFEEHNGPFKPLKLSHAFSMISFLKSFIKKSGSSSYEPKRYSLDSHKIVASVSKIVSQEKEFSPKRNSHY